MIAQFEVLAPKTIQEALQLISGNPRAKILAGGTDVITGFHQGSSRFIDTTTLIDINHIPEMHAITETDSHIVIGAGTPFTHIVENPGVIKYFPLLAESCSVIGSLQIRNRATIGGNFINNAPCADSVPALLVYEAKIRIQSAISDREMPLADFLVKPYKTQLKPDEIVTEVILTKFDDGYKGNFYKLGRRRGVAISRLTIAVFGKVENDIITDIRIASGAVTPIGMRIAELEQKLIGKPANDDSLKEAAIELGKIILEKTGIRWSAPYKLPVMQQVCYQQLHTLVFGKE
ncbi:MAG: FAD binding domain-containing protein [Ignavibacteria bacterium]|nr:FAD binding domain-containing protein [Ignavibacteria bacterium]